ncbi:MAG: hypothetical protein ACI4EF_02950 [Coprococcus sp.]
MVKWKKNLCIMLSATMMASCATGLGEVKAAENSEKNGAETESSEAEQLEAALTSEITNDNAEDADKEETVYVMSDASGNVENITVSNWLKNVTGEDSINDYTKLSDIENVKGYEQYVENDDGSITWQSNGSDIYYQGTSSEALPVDVKVSYKLDGKTIAPEELAGKSGRVTIRFDYTNNTSSKVNVGNEDKNVITPFVMMSGTVLPVDKFSNIQVENGKVLSEGSNAIVVGYAVPGLKQCLMDGVDDKDMSDAIDGIDVPEYVEITADVENFSLAMTMTVGLTDMLSSDKKDIDIDSDLSDVKNDINTLGSSADQLVDGTETLMNGLETLKDGTYSLRTGADKLLTGADSLDTYTGELADGTLQLYNAVNNTLVPGIYSLKNGSYKLMTDGGKPLKKGAADVRDGVNSVYAGEKQLNDGVDKLIAGYAGDKENTGAVKGASNLASGSTTLKDGAKLVYDGASALNIGAAQVSTGVDKLIDVMNTMPATISDSLMEKANEALTSNGFSSLEAGGLNQVLTKMEQLKTAIAQMASSGLDNNVSVTATATDVTDTSAVFDSYMTQYAALAQLYGSVSTLQSAATELSAGIQLQLDAMEGENGDITKLQTGAKTVAEKSKDLKDGAKQVYDGASALSDGATTLSTGINALYKGSKDVSKGLGELMTGTKTLKKGANTLADGAGSVADKMKELYNGTVTLAKGGDSLKTSTEKLNSGAGSISDGASELKDGIKTLSDGTVTLDDGATELKDGGADLGNGMKQFNEEGIKKLTEMFSGDYKADIEYVEALFGQEAAYNNYSGALDGVNTNVKFIYETGAIE